MAGDGARLRRSGPALAVALGAAVAAVYAETLGYPFLRYDDYDFIVDNPFVRAGLTWRGALWAIGGVHAVSWQPLTWLSHMLDCTLFGLDPRGHHAVSVLLHVANTLGVFWVSTRLTHSVGRSAVVAGLFGLHPLHVEPVAWIAERKELLAMLFGLLALAAWERHVRAEPGGRGRRAYLAALLAFAASLASKPMWVSLPLLLLILDIWPLRRLSALSPGVLWPLVREKLPLVLLAGATSIVTLRAQSIGIAWDTPFSLRAGNAVLACAAYLRRTFAPTDLAAFYPFPSSVDGGDVAFAAVTLCALTAGSLAAWRRAPYLSAGWLWFLVALLPVLGLVRVGHQSMADRYTYVPLLGLFVALVFGAHSVGRSLRLRESLLAGIAVVVLVGLSFWTRAQVHTWRDEHTLFTRVLAVTEPSAYALTELGAALARRSDTEAAIERYEHALRLDPGHARAHFLLGTVRLERRELESAGRHLERALALAPPRPHTFYHLGLARERAGDFREAAARFQSELALDPNHLGALTHLSALRAAHPDPQLRDGVEAVRLAQRASALTGESSPHELDILSAALAETGDFAAATATAERALEMARNAGEAELVPRIERHRAAYLRREPIRMRPPQRREGGRP